MLKINQERLLKAITNNDEFIGFCLACGEEALEIEPDARKYTCEFCSAREVYGAEETLIMGAYE